jgi:hypothetical protein
MSSLQALSSSVLSSLGQAEFPSTPAGILNPSEVGVANKVWLPNRADVANAWETDNAGNFETTVDTGNIDRWRNLGGDAGVNWPHALRLGLLAPTRQDDSVGAEDSVFFNQEAELTITLPADFEQNDLLGHVALMIPGLPSFGFGRIISFGKTGVNDYNTVGSATVALSDNNGPFTCIRNNVFAIAPDTVAYATLYVVKFKIDATSVECWMNGVSQGALPHGAAATLDFNKILIGAGLGAGASAYILGHLLELSLCSGNTSQDEENLDAYFEGKYL